MELNSIFAKIYYKYMINRCLYDELQRVGEAFSVVLLTGPRQSGKTTLCKMVFSDYDYVTLEAPDTRVLVATDPLSYLRAHTHGLIIDEAQHLPELFSYIQVAVDEDKSRRYILTGSSNFSLMERITQSLAGRAAILNLLPLSVKELADYSISDTDELMVRGFYPGVWGDGKEPRDVYGNYYATYIERDLRNLLNIRNLSLFQHFVRLLAGSVSQEFNAAKFANSVGVDLKTVQSWMSILEASFVVYRLPPYYRNIGKRIIKSHKAYFTDTGLACYLLGISNPSQLVNHPLRGALFENMVIGEFVKNQYNQGHRPNFYFYRDATMHEVDLIEEVSFDVLDAYEIKSAQRFNTDFLKGLTYLRNLYPGQVRSMTVIYDGEERLDASDFAVRNFRNQFQ